MTCIFGTEHVYHSGFVFQCWSFEESPFKEHWSVDQGLCTCEFVLDERCGWEVNSLGKHLVLFGSTRSTFLLLFSLSLGLIGNVTDEWHNKAWPHERTFSYWTPNRDCLIKPTLFQIQPLALIRLWRILFYCCWENCEKISKVLQIWWFDISFLLQSSSERCIYSNFLNWPRSPPDFQESYRLVSHLTFICPI